MGKVPAAGHKLARSCSGHRPSHRLDIWWRTPGVSRGQPNGIEPDTRPGLAAAAFDFEPSIAAVDTLTDSRGGLCETAWEVRRAVANDRGVWLKSPAARQGPLIHVDSPPVRTTPKARIPSGHRYVRSIAFRDQLDWIGAAWILAAPASAA